MTIEQEQPIFTPDAQAVFMKALGMDLARGAKKFEMDKDESAMNPIEATDSIRTALDNTGVSQEYIDAVVELKNDPDVQKAVSIFSKALDGEEDILQLNDMVPRAENSKSSGFIAFVDDPGMNGAVLKRTIDENGETDMVRYSNYISGAGTSVGGFLADLPGTVSDLQQSIAGTALFRYTKLEGQLKKYSHDLSKVIEENDKFTKQFLIDPEEAFRNRKPYYVNLGEVRGDPSVGFVKVEAESTKTKLLRETFKANVAVEQAKIKNRGKLKAQKILGKVGTGIGVATTGFGLAQGGVDIAAGDQMIQNAERQLKNKEITQDEYNKTMRDARLRIAQGSFGVGDGLNNVRALVVDKLGDKVKTFSKGAKMGLRFASAVGGAFAIGMGVTSIAKNAIAAHDASESGNIGKAAMYGIMAALDCVSVILDGASMVLDFVPVIGQAISFVVDVVNTIVNVVNMVIGFFADMVDTRTPEAKLREAFNEHIESAEFQSFLENQEKIYSDLGYDVLQFIVDAKTLGLEEEGTDPKDMFESLMRGLNDEAKKDLESNNLRMAILDRSESARILHGRLKDDLIRGGTGNDTLYGHAGDDILFGETGDDTIYGGPGNDFLSGGVGKNFLYGGVGDDFISFKPGIDVVASGGAGIDSIKLLANFFVQSSQQVSKGLLLPPSGRNRVFVDLSLQSQEKGGHAGIALGALIRGLDMLENKMHKSAFAFGSQLKGDVLQLFEGSTKTVAQNTINDKYLWLLAWDSGLAYLTDGKYVYRCGPAEAGNRVITEVTLSIDPSEAVYDEDNNCMKYNTKQLSAALGFAFWTSSSVSGIENVILDDEIEATGQSNMHANVIGNESVRMIDLKGGDNEYVYTGDGNTVVMFTVCYTPRANIMKYIVGGSGNNVLVIHGKNIEVNRGPSRSCRMNQVVLLDHNINVVEASHNRNTCNTGVWEDRQFGKVDRAVFIKNMQTIQLSSTSNVIHAFYVDSVNLSDGHRFIVDSCAPCNLMGTQGDDFVSMKRVATGKLDGHMGRNVLSLEESEITTPIAIDLGSEANPVGSVTGESIHVYLYRFHSIQGHSFVSSIIGHDVEDNLLVANGGECTIEARGGNNTMIAKRGRHTLIGGSGQDGYELYSPNPPEFVVVSISKTKEGEIDASARDGLWTSNSLSIDVLESESQHLSIISNSLMVVDGSGNTMSNDLVKCENGKIVFTPSNTFNNLATGSSTTIRIKYTTEGSLARVREVNQGNRLKLHSVTDKSELKVRIDAEKNLEFTTSSGRTIFKDLVWGDMYRARVTNLEVLASDFSKRFPVIQMSGTDEAKAMLEKDVYDFITGGLSHLKNASTDTVDGRKRQNPTVFDSMLDAKDTEATEIIVGTGKNVLLGRRRNVSYRAENGDNIIDLSYLGSASNGTMNRTFVEASEGTVVVVISVDSIGSNPVAIQFTKPGIREGSEGKKSLVIKGTLPSTVRAVRWTQQPDMKWAVVDTSIPNQEKTIIVMDQYPDFMMFSNSIEGEEVNVLVDDVNHFWSTKLESGTYLSRRLYSSKYEQQLDLSALSTPYNFSLRLTPGQTWLELALCNEAVELYKFSCEFHSETSIDAVKIAQRIRGQFSRGIKLKEETLMAPGIRRLVMDCFAEKRFMIIGASGSDRVVYASDVSADYRVADGNALIFADDEGGRITGGRGNNIIKVNDSNMTIGVGECADDGRSIVEIGRGVTETMLTLSANTYLIFNGWSSNYLRQSFRTQSASGGSLSSSFSETDPFVILKDGIVVARLNRAPSYILFRDADQIGVVDDVLLFCRESGRWVAKLVINSNSGRVSLNVPDVDEITFNVGAKGRNVWLFSYDERMRTPLTNIAEFSIGTILAINSRSDFSIPHAATFIATYMPGGIRFHDKHVLSRDLESYLREAMARRTSFSAITYSQANAGELGFTFEDVRKNLDPHKHLYEVVDATLSTLFVSNIDPAGKIVGLEPEETEEVKESVEVREGRNSSSPIIISQATYPSFLPELKKIPAKKMAVTWKGYTYYAFEPIDATESNVFLVEWNGREWCRTFTASYKQTFTGMSKATHWRTHEPGINVNAAYAPHGPLFLLNQQLWLMSVEEGRNSPLPLIVCRASYPESLPDASLQIPHTRMAVTWHGVTYFPFRSTTNETEFCLVQWDGSNWGKRIPVTGKGRLLDICRGYSEAIQLTFERWTFFVSSDSLRVEA